MPELTSSAGARKLVLELGGELGGLEADVDLEEPPQAPGLEVAGAGENVLAVGEERLGVQHLRVAEELHAGVEQPLMVELLGGAAGPVVRVRRDEQADARAALRRPDDPPDHAAVGDVGVHDVERVARSVDQRRDRVVIGL